jgi:hypothetical protein
MSYPVNALITGTFTLLDQAMPPAGVTGATFATKTAILSTNEATTTTLTVTELSGGKYRFTFTPTAVGDWDCLVVYNAGGLYRRFEGTYNVVTADQADPIASTRAAKLDSLGAAGVTFSGPVANGGSATVYAGDDYLNADGRALTWSSSVWPSLTGATVTLTARTANRTVLLTKTGTVLSANSVRVDLTKADTALAAGVYPFVVSAALSGSADKVTLVDGWLTVIAAGGA